MPAGDRFTGFKTAAKNFQNFVDSCRGPGTYEYEKSNKPKLFSDASTLVTVNNVTNSMGNRHHSPVKPRGLAKAGRILVQSESE